MTPREFVKKWKAVELEEPSAAQEHFLDLCELVGHPKPAAADPKGESFAFESCPPEQSDIFCLVQRA